MVLKIEAHCAVFVKWACYCGIQFLSLIQEHASDFDAFIPVGEKLKKEAARTFHTPNYLRQANMLQYVSLSTLWQCRS